MAEKKYIIDNAELMAEWNWEKNIEFDFDPKLLTVGSGKKVWWKCTGTLWTPVPYSRRSRSLTITCLLRVDILKMCRSRQRWTAQSFS